MTPKRLMSWTLAFMNLSGGAAFLVLAHQRSDKLFYFTSGWMLSIGVCLTVMGWLIGKIELRLKNSRAQMDAIRNDFERMLKESRSQKKDQ